MNEKKPTCPNCNSENVAWIFWGYPAMTQELEEAVKKKEIIFGGCIISENDPKWECNHCNHRWGDAEHNFEGDTDSFDFDQGFNIEEVYDQ